MHFRQPRRKMKIQKSRHSVSDLYPKKMLMGADRIFAAVYKKV